ncbi:MAG: hypothetical protein HY290_20160 [Planctomycetia bacterium]|nr:hypothetical protein [Planctomycetia bacterium]
MPVATESAHELKELPLNAQLALAARCARRVVNLFRLEPNHPELATCLKAVGAAIRITELLAGGNEVEPAELAHAEEGTVRAVVAASEMQPPNERAAYAANSAYAALCAAKAALESQHGQADGDAIDRFVEAVQIARDSAASADDRIERAVRLDREMLSRMFLGSFPDFGEPLDASETGMLGPLFQDLSRGLGSPHQPGAADGKDKSKTSGTSRTRLRKVSEIEATPQASATPAQLAEIETQRRQIEAERLQVQTERARLATDRTAFDEMKRQLEAAKADSDRQRAQEQQQRERIEAERHVLNAKTGDLDEARRSIENERQRAIEESARLAADRATLEGKVQALRESQLAADEQRQRLADDAAQLDLDREQFRRTCEEFEQHRQALDGRELMIAARRSSLDARHSELDTWQAGLNSRQAEIESRRAEIDTRQAEIDSRRAGLDARQIQLDLHETSLAEQAAELDASRKHFDDEMQTARVQLEAEWNESRAAIDAERNEVRAAFESLQNERREFLEQRLAWKPESPQS